MVEVDETTQDAMRQAAGLLRKYMRDLEMRLSLLEAEWRDRRVQVRELQERARVLSVELFTAANGRPLRESYEGALADLYDQPAEVVALATDAGADRPQTSTRLAR